MRSETELELARAIVDEVGDATFGARLRAALPPEPPLDPALEERIVRAGVDAVSGSESTASAAPWFAGLRAALAGLWRPAPLALAAATFVLGLSVSGPREASSPRSHAYGGERTDTEPHRPDEQLLGEVDELVDAHAYERARAFIVQSRPRVQDGLVAWKLTLRLAEIELALGRVDSARQMMDEDARVLEIRRVDAAIASAEASTNAEGSIVPESDQPAPPPR